VVNPDKDAWIGKERIRWARYFSVPMVEHTPEGFPPVTLATERALCAVSLKSPGKLVSTIEALYYSFWVQGNTKIGQVEGFSPVLESVFGKDGAQEILQVVR
jgi:2-hydroxychromene-2-carboxylate isomerase